MSNATQGVLAVSVQDGAGSPTTADRTLSDDEFFGAFVFVLSGSPTVPFALAVPATGAHAFAVRNTTAQSVTVRGGAGASVTIAAGQIRLLHADGTDVIPLAPATA